MSETKCSESDLNVLLCCPFCDGDVDIVRGDSLHGSYRWYKVYCKSCQNRTWEHRKKKDAINAWNRRKETNRLKSIMIKVASSLARELQDDAITEFQDRRLYKLIQELKDT